MTAVWLCAQEILTESFDPILDLVTGADLMMAMVYAQELGDWDYTGMYTAVLRRRVRPSSSYRPSLTFYFQPPCPLITSMPINKVGGTWRCRHNFGSYGNEQGSSALGVCI